MNRVRIFSSLRKIRITTFCTFFLEEKKMLLPKRDSIFKEHREDLYESIRIKKEKNKIRTT